MMKLALFETFWTFHILWGGGGLKQKSKFDVFFELKNVSYTMKNVYHVRIFDAKK